MKFIFLWSYLLFVNLFAFLLMGWDKRQAKSGAWRQSERSLLMVAAIGGSLGMYMGSKFWRHKTYKKNFKRPFYGIIIGQIILLISCVLFYWKTC